MDLVSPNVPSNLFKRLNKMQFGDKPYEYEVTHKKSNLGFFVKRQRALTRERERHTHTDRQRSTYKFFSLHVHYSFLFYFFRFEKF